MRVSKIVISITVPIFLIMLFASLLTTKQYLLLSEGLYEEHEAIEFDHEYVSDRVMGYLNYRYKSLDIGSFDGDTESVFGDEELRHMDDVKNLYTMLRLVALGSLVVAVSLSYYIFKKDKKELIRTYKNLYYGPMVFIVILGGYMIIDFGGAFTMFHKLFFSNDDWQLSSTDALIQLLPFKFWLTSAVIILVLFASSIAGIHFVFKKIERKRYS